MITLSRNIVGKGENAGYQHFLLFQQCFEKASVPDKSKGVIVRERVNSLPNDKFLDWSKLEAFADNKTNVTLNRNSFWDGGKRCGKRRKCWLPAFSPFHTIFSKLSFPEVLKVGIVWEKVKEKGENAERICGPIK